MQTINGKLITPEPIELEELKGNIKQVEQSFKSLKSDLILLKIQENKEYIEQIQSWQLSLKCLEQLYKRLFILSLISIAGLITLSFLLYLARPSVPNTSHVKTSLRDSIQFE